MDRFISPPPCSHKAICDCNPVNCFTGSSEGMNLGHSVRQGDGKGQEYDIEPKFRINTAFSLNMLHKVFATFDAEKRGIVQSIGLGGLFKVHNQRLQCKDLIYTLLSRMDPITGSIDLSNGVLTVADKDVHLVLDIPYKGVEIRLSSRPAVVLDKVKMALLLGPDADLNMEVVIGILLKDYGRKMSQPEREAFKVAAIIFADSCFLGPRGDNKKINKDILDHVADPSRICEVNWSRYVLSVLRRLAAKVQQSTISSQKSIFLEGCLLFLLVFYLDNLSAGFLSPAYDCFPRIAKYTPRLVSELVSYDRHRRMTHTIRQFGRAKLRPSEDVVYSRSIGTTKETPMPRTRQNVPIMSSHKVINIQSSGSCSLTDIDILKTRKNFEDSETIVAFDQYLEIFRSQLCQATDEFQRKVHSLLRKYPDPRREGSPPRSALKGDTIPDEVLDTISPICLGAKAISRAGYRTISSSSDGSIIGSSSVAMHNAECEEFPLHLSPHYPTLLNSGSGLLNSSIHDLEEGTQRSWILVDETEGEVSICDHGCSSQIHFGPSSFDLEVRDKDIQFRAIMEIIRVLPRCSDEERKKYWYVHNVPTCIHIDGHSLYSAFYCDIDFSSDIMDAVMRLYHEFDDAFYLQCPQKRWRHYLAPSWAEIALSEDNNWELPLVKDMINGDHIGYVVGDCQLILVPVRVLGQWALYAWDFGRKQITVLDPVFSTPELLNSKHKSVATKLHNALLRCKQEICGQFEPLNIIWRLKYLPANDCIPSNKSGLYTVFYSRFFDGETVTHSMIVEDSVTLFQTNLLCQLPESAGNQASCPIEITRAITEK